MGSWLKGYPKFGEPNPIPVAGSVNVQLQGDTLKAYGGSLSVLPSTLEARVSLLESKLKLADRQINETGLRLEEERKSRIDALNSEEVARIEGDAVVWKQLEEAVVGGISLETVGIVWLACDVTLSSLSEELACLVTRLV
jgi:hypothetical protein